MAERPSGIVSNVLLGAVALVGAGLVASNVMSGECGMCAMFSGSTEVPPSKPGGVDAPESPVTTIESSEPEPTTCCDDDMVPCQECATDGRTSAGHQATDVRTPPTRR